MYLAALEHAFLRAVAAPAGGEEAALDMFGELGRCVAQAHSGIVAGAGVALASIVKGGIGFALQARCRPCGSSSARRLSVVAQAFCGMRTLRRVCVGSAPSWGPFPASGRPPTTLHALALPPSP